MREPLPLPTEPPFTAHIGNLSFDATSDDIADLFSACGVTNVRIVEDKLTKSPKGFGYVEFETVDGLKRALDMSGATLQGRSVRISIAEPRKCCISIGTVPKLTSAQPRSAMSRNSTGLAKAPSQICLLAVCLIAPVSDATWMPRPMRAATVAADQTDLAISAIGRGKALCPLVPGLSEKAARSAMTDPDSDEALPPGARDARRMARGPLAANSMPRVRPNLTTRGGPG